MNRSILLFVCCAISAVLSAQPTDIYINELLATKAKEHSFPAIAAAVITSDTIVYGIYGTTRLNGSDTVHLTDKFHLGSNTKAITALLAFKQEEEGKVRLSMRFLDVFPELKGKILPAYDTITLDGLLSHQSGIPAYTSGIEYLKIPELKGSLYEQHYAFAEKVLNQEPVKHGTYSNAGYVLAALMMEKITGRSYAQLVDQFMRSNRWDYYIGFPNKQNIRYPWGHWNEKNTITALDSNHFYKLKPYVVPAGDISMNIIDYAKYIQMNLCGLQGTDGYITAKGFQRLHFGKPGYAYGWGNVIKGDTMISMHNGSAGTYFCHAILYPQQNIAVMLLTNTALPQQTQALMEIREMLLIRWKDIQNTRN